MLATDRTTTSKKLELMLSIYHFDNKLHARPTQFPIEYQSEKCRQEIPSDPSLIMKESLDQSFGAPACVSH